MHLTHVRAAVRKVTLAAIMSWAPLSLAVIVPEGFAQETGSQSTAPSATPSLRFELRDQPGGFVRLDIETGALSFCKVGDGRLTCSVSAEEREAYQNEIARLEDRILALEKRVKLLEPGALAVPGAKLGDRLAVPPEAIPEPSSPDGNGGSPSENARPDEDKSPDTASEAARREFEKAMEFAERAMRRFFDVVQDMRKEMEAGEAK